MEPSLIALLFTFIVSAEVYHIIIRAVLAEKYYNSTKTNNSEQLEEILMLALEEAYPDSYNITEATENILFITAFLETQLFSTENYNSMSHVDLQMDIAQEDMDRKQDLLNFNEGVHFDEVVMTGAVFRAETFENVSSVHLPWIYLPPHKSRGVMLLQMTQDYMQTAVDAFYIFVFGTIEDVSYLPVDYVLKSAQAISMLTLPRDKLEAVWQLVRGSKRFDEINITTLEMYRPLFKYVSGTDMARLNLSNNDILYYIGTHIDLNRHQLGIVAKTYIKLNPLWHTTKYLNLLNNIICGIPILILRTMKDSVYLQLNDQFFYQIKACDSLQRYFFLSQMTKPQALGRPYSWSAQDIAQLGFLFLEIGTHEMQEINPEAMIGLSAEVVAEMKPHLMKSMKPIQLQYSSERVRNIILKILMNVEQSYKADLNSTTRYSYTFPCLIFCLVHTLFPKSSFMPL